MAEDHWNVEQSESAVTPGAGAFASGHTDTAERTDEILAATAFGADTTSTRLRPPRAAARATPRKAPAAPKTPHTAKARTPRR